MGVTGLSTEGNPMALDPTRRRPLRVLAATAAFGLLPLLAACGDSDDDDDDDDDGLGARTAVVQVVGS